MPDHAAAAPVRAFWSGTIAFGLVSIPVDFYAAARARQTSMKMVDAEGHPLGRQYASASSGRPLSMDDIVRGYETDDGKMVVISDEEFERAAPETTRDIELNRFVPLEQIPPSYFVRPYFLAPAQRAGKAYSLLAETMERAGKVGIGRLVMRGHEYMVAIIAEQGALRAETLRHADELRTPESIGLPDPATRARNRVAAFAREIDRLLEKRLDLHELEDREAEALEALATRKLRSGKDVVSLDSADDEEPAEGSAQVVDLVALLRKSLGGKVTMPAPPGAERRSEQGRQRARARTAAGAGAGEAAAEAPTRQELYALATELGIAGRSKMDKGELARAVKAARQRRAA